MKPATSRAAPAGPVTSCSRSDSVDRLFERVAERSLLAQGALEILQLSNGSHRKASELRQIVQPDASLVAMILRRVNSPYYRFDQPVCDVEQAAQLLGFAEFRNLALTVHLSRVFHTPLEQDGFSMRRLWTHCVAVAAGAQLVSRVCGCGVAADAYLAGLLHDIGLVYASRHIWGEFEGVVRRVRGGMSTMEAESAVYGFHHGRLGGFLTRRWGLPQAIVDGVEYHHSADVYHGAHEELVFVVSAANYLCSRAGWTSLGVHNSQLPPDSVYRLLGLDGVALSVIWEELQTTLEHASSLAEA